jgi:proline iminopeptidase
LYAEPRLRTAKRMNRTLWLALSPLIFACPPDRPASFWRPSAVSREGYVEGASAGVRLFYRLQGTGREPVVFVQGGPGADMRDVAPDFEPLERGRTFIHYDHRGGGRSTLPDDTALLDISYFVEDLEAVRRHFGLERMTIVANSFGPIIAALYAGKYPERVERMVFVAPTPPFRRFGEQYMKTVYGALTDPQRKRVREIFQSLSTAEDPIAVCREFEEFTAPQTVAHPESRARRKAESCSGTKESIHYGMTKSGLITPRTVKEDEFLAALGKISAPTLILHGDKDPYPLAGAELMAQHIRT